MDNNFTPRKRSLFWPLVLIAAGTILLLINLKVLEGNLTWNMILRLWPLLLIAGGLDEIYRYRRFAGPVFWIGIGVLLLLNNLGLFPFGSWFNLLRYWPVILIVAGIDIMLGRQHRLIPALTGVLLGLALIGGLLWLVIAAPLSTTSYQTETIAQPLGKITQAEVDISAVTGQMQIRSTAGSENLAEGTLHLANSETIQKNFETDGGKAVYRLKSQGIYPTFPAIGPNTATNWDLHLSGKIPLALSTHMIVGEQKVDLRDLKIQEAKSETIIGRSVLTLPEEGDFEIRDSVVIGEMVVLVPKDLAVEIWKETAITAFTVPADFRQEGMHYISPAASGATEKIRLHVSLPIGVVQIAYLP